MLKYGLIFSSLIYLVAAAGELVIVQAPKSLEFSGSDAIEGDHVVDVFSASLGYTLQNGLNWPGLTIKNPFGFAKMLTVVAFDGIASLGKFENHTVFPISSNLNERAIWNALEQNVIEHNPTENREKSIIRVASEIIDDEQSSQVNTDFTQDFLCINEEVAKLKKFMDDVKENRISKDSPLINWFSLPCLHILTDVRGSDDPVIDAYKNEFQELILNLSESLKAASNNQALVAVITGDSSHTRHIRAPGDPVTNTTNTTPGNRATVFTSSYPAIFNIFLWFGVTFVISLIAISYFIATMDPGRDSIIYRMTSNRMKKDS